MSSYLVYWKPQNVNWKKPSSDKIRHAASNQFYKVSPGDRLYFITYRSGHFYLLGRMVVHKIMGGSFRGQAVHMCSSFRGQAVHM